MNPSFEPLFIGFRMRVSLTCSRLPYIRVCDCVRQTTSTISILAVVVFYTLFLHFFFLLPGPYSQTRESILMRSKKGIGDYFNSINISLFNFVFSQYIYAKQAIHYSTACTRNELHFEEMCIAYHSRLVRNFNFP